MNRLIFMQNVLASVGGLNAQEILSGERISAFLPQIDGSSAAGPAQLPQLFETLFHLAPIGIAVGGADYRFLKVNRALADFVQIPENELIGKDFRSITHPDDVLLTVEKHRALIQGKEEPVTFEKRYVRRDNQIAWGQVTTTLVRDDSGKFICSLSMVVDISARKSAEKKLQETNDSLSQSNRELERFAVLASHDLREPLRTISQFLELLKTRYSSNWNEEANEFVDVAAQSANRLELMVRSILTLTEMRLSRSRYDTVPVGSVIKNAIDNLKYCLKESGAKVYFESMPDVTCVPSLLTEVFQNLIENSVKYRANVPPRIEIGCQRYHDDWIFSIRDNGVGFSSVEAVNLFQPFCRATQTGSGSGIGLSLCRKIVEAHGGKIWIDSKPEEGTIAYFSIPAVID